MGCARLSQAMKARDPVHHEKQRAELAHAEAELDRSRNEHGSQSQQVPLNSTSITSSRSRPAELLKIYREGLIPQASTAVQAGLAP